MTDSLSIDATSTFDLGTNALIVNYLGTTSSVNAIEALIRNARGVDGGWTHPGLTSSNASGDSSGRTVVATAEATEMFGTFPAFFAGQSIDSTTVIVRATIAGDFDLDRSVAFSDLLRLAQQYGQSEMRYAQGNVDFSDDGSVAFDDLLLLAQTYGQAFATSAPLATSSSDRSKRRSVGSDVLS